MSSLGNCHIFQWDFLQLFALALGPEGRASVYLVAANIARPLAGQGKQTGDNLLLETPKGGASDRGRRLHLAADSKLAGSARAWGSLNREGELREGQSGRGGAPRRWPAAVAFS